MAVLQGGRRERCEACEREEKKKGRGGALLTGGEETAWRGTDLVVAGGATDEDGGVRIQRTARWSEAEEAATFEDTGIGGDAARGRQRRSPRWSPWRVKAGRTAAGQRVDELWLLVRVGARENRGAVVLCSLASSSKAKGIHDAKRNRSGRIPRWDLSVAAAEGWMGQLPRN